LADGLSKTREFAEKKSSCNGMTLSIDLGG
jgi:hypothetical protein